MCYACLIESNSSVMPGVFADVSSLLFFVVVVVLAAAILEKIAFVCWSIFLGCGGIFLQWPFVILLLSCVNSTLGLLVVDRVDLCIGLLQHHTRIITSQ